MKITAEVLVGEPALHPLPFHVVEAPTVTVILDALLQLPLVIVHVSV